MDNLKKQLGQNIKLIRKARKLTQEKLAEIVGIGTPNISYIESGKFAPSIDTLQKIALALNVEPYELYKFSSQKSSDDMLNEIISALEGNDKLINLVYKFYCVVKFEI